MTATGAADGSHRYGQLTYTSVDDDQGAGGWRVKDQVGLSDRESESLLSRVSTRLDAGRELPRFPSPAELNRFPRRLVYAPSTGGMAWWHTAPAGSDASGRPGNVFAHVTLDRCPDSGSTVRPVDLWRSSDWLCPFGPDAVRAATVTLPGPPAPGTAVTRQAVVAFVLDLHQFRLGTLVALLDACSAAMAGGPGVVFAAEDVDTAAQWIGAVSYLMPVQHARNLFFSTLERPSTLDLARDQSVHLACVPRRDVQGWSPGPSWVLVEEGEAIEMGDLGGRPHRTSRGAEIVVTEWSAIAQVALIDVATAEVVLAQLDELTRGLEGSEPAWGLALLAAVADGVLAEARGEAAAVLVRSNPPRMPAGHEVVAAVRQLFEEQAGGSAEQAWRSLAEVVRPEAVAGPVPEILLGVYAALAVQDLQWLGRPGGVPLPATSRLRQEDVGAVIAAALGTLRRWGTVASPDRPAALGVAAMADLVARLGLDDDELDHRLRQALRQRFTPRLSTPEGPELVAALGHFDEVTQRTFLRPEVETDQAVEVGRPLGARLPREVVLWLYPDRPAPVQVGRHLNLENQRLRTELAAQLASSEPLSHRDAAERPLVLCALLDSGAVGDVELGRHLGPPTWSVDDLWGVESRHPGRLPPATYGPTLKAAPAGEHLAVLSQALLDRRPEGPDDQPTVFDLARLRLAVDQPWHLETGAGFASALRALVAGGAYAARLPEVTVDPCLRSDLLPALVVAAVLGCGQPQLALAQGALGAQPRVLNEAAVHRVRSALDAHADLVEVALLAMSHDPLFPAPDLVTAETRWLAGCLVEGAGGTPVLRSYLERRLAQFSVYGLEVRSRMRSAVQRRLPPTVPNREREIRAVDKFTLTWMKNLIHDESRQGRWKVRL